MRRGGPATRTTRRAAILLIAALVTLIPAFVTGCGSGEASGSAGPSGGGLEIGYVKRDESVAVSNLTKVLLEELGREDVELKLVEPGSALRDVAEGKVDVFQDVWLPNDEEQLAAVEDDVALLNPWLIGTTRSSLAVPAYMGVRSLEGLDATGATKALGVRPDAAAVSEQVPPGTLSRYGLERDFDYPSASAMLAGVDRLYEARKPFVFLAWTPHWMNLEYDFNYLEDPKGVLSDLTQPNRLHMVVRKDLKQEDPRAYALMDTILLTEYQITDLQLAIRNADSPEKGARAWIKENTDLTRGWLKTVRERFSEND